MCSSDLRLKSGPPELPGFTAASVCSTSRIERPVNEDCVVRSVALMMPDVTVNGWSNGAPIVTISFLTIGFQTLANLAAGATGMKLRHYLPAVTIGGLLWAVGVTVAGYFLGNIEFVKKNIELILILVVFVSIVPIIIEYINHRRQRKGLA